MEFKVIFQTAFLSIQHRINRNIMEFKVVRSAFVYTLFIRINRNIMEFKVDFESGKQVISLELIET